MPGCTLYDALATIPDPRHRHGRVHPLPAVLGLVARALLMGRKRPKGIAWFGRQHGTPLAHALGSRRGKTPAASTLSRTPRRFDPRQLEANRSRWVAGRIDPTAVEQIALDGKTRRGSRDGDVPGQHLVAAHAPAVQAVLAALRNAAVHLLGTARAASRVAAIEILQIDIEHAKRLIGIPQCE